MIKKPLALLLVMFVAITASGLNIATRVLNPSQQTQTDTTKVRTDNNGKVYPPLPPNADRLFYLQRSTNINALSYDINIDKDTGKPDEDSPLHIYWLQYAEKNGEPSELTFIQRKFAYGVSSNALGNDRYDIRIMSYKKIPLTLMRAADGKYHIFATVAKKQMLLQNIFIQIDGGSLWSPNVVYIEMKGTDPVTGKEVTERFKP
ncbi:MAG: DUF4833 domain-containing protein [Bacteroidota bacterium]